MQAFEVSGTIDPTGRLILDQPLQVSHPGRTRLIVLSDNNPESNQAAIPPTHIFSHPTRQQFAFDPNAQPIWELATEISAQVPAEEWAKLPTDLVRNFDKY